MPRKNRLSPRDIAAIFTRLRRWAASLEYAPVIDLMASQGDTPWRILAATMLSARTKDETTAAAARRLFAAADSPEKTLKVPVAKLEKLIFPVGFYQVKASRLHDLARAVIERHGGKVPRTLDELTALPGIGIKTATLVQIKAFGIDEICVDTHVHRIANMWGLVATKQPDDTRPALKKVVPKKHWRSVNQDLVTLGQTICKPQKHYCDRCPVSDLCPVSTTR
ncbi:MAG TPA: endonuclease III [bacterium]|nr:endonuclease III [bacterium]